MCLLNVKLCCSAILTALLMAGGLTSFRSPSACISVSSSGNADRLGCVIAQEFPELSHIHYFCLRQSIVSRSNKMQMLSDLE